MKPIGPLMREHRLIERMINILPGKIKTVNDLTIDTQVVLVAIDFFRTYVDHTHHDKEEEILFRELAKKQLSLEDRKIMEELIEEHALARRMVTALYEAIKLYSLSNPQSSNEVVKLIDELVKLYPDHIKKEDQRFFYPCLTYLTKEEQDAMLSEFWEFDRKLIHEKYQKVVEDLIIVKT